jgi:hypothetical protein
VGVQYLVIGTDYGSSRNGKNVKADEKYIE